MRESRTWDASFSAEGRKSTSLVHHGLAVEIAGGALVRVVRVVRAFALGPFVSATPVLPIGSSFGSGGVADTTARFYLVLTGGIELRVTFD